MSDAGHEVIVANARQLPLVYAANYKNDVLDGEKLARVARTDVRLSGTCSTAVGSSSKP